MARAGYNVGISTQTPLFRFSPEWRGAGVDLRSKRAGLLHGSPGGIGRMVLPLLGRLHKSGWLRHAHWISLDPKAPPEVKVRPLPLTLQHLSLSPPELEAYARTKERLWSVLHGLSEPEWGSKDFRFYTRYNWYASDALLALMPDLDVAWVHDFQLLQVGALVGLAAPSVLRWHVPFDPDRINWYTRQFLLRSMEDFDALIVSTRRDKRGLVKAGYHGFVHQIYPYIEPKDWPTPSRSHIQTVEDRLDLRPDDPVVLMVARMDPMKRHDVAIRALARAARQHRRARLVLVGNGSFTSTGLKQTKAGKWARRLQALARRLKVQDQIEFAHWIPDEQLAPLYARADAVVLPSDIEGFGLTVLEAWRYSRPALVSSGAGVAEVIRDGENGHVFPAGADAQLAASLSKVLERREKSARMGAAGRQDLPRFTAQKAAPRVAMVLEEAVDRFGGA